MRSSALVCLACAVASADAPKPKLVDVVNTTGLYGDWAAYEGEHRVDDKLVPLRAIVQMGKVESNIRIVWYEGLAGNETRFHARTTVARPNPIDEVADFVAALTKSSTSLPKGNALEASTCKADKDVPCTIARFTVDTYAVVVGFAENVRALGVTHLEVTDAKKNVMAKLQLVGFGRAKRSEMGMPVPTNLVDVEPGLGTGRPIRRPPPPSVAIGQPQAAGELDKAIIRRYVKRNVQKITYCYEKNLLVKPTLQGIVTVKFEIAGDGKVASASASGVDTEVSDCVAAVVKAIEFPKPKDGKVVKVTYPITFKPTGD